MVACCSAALCLSFNRTATAAEIEWGDAFEVTAAEDISNPEGSTVHVAADFNNDAGWATGDDHIINGIEFQQSPAAGIGDLVTSLGSGP